MKRNHEKGGMLAFDMGGPCNKVAYAFALACMETGNYAPMAANFVACCAPPLAVALAMLIAPKKFTDEDRSGIPGCFAGALCMITEFAIPYAAKNIKYIPCFMVGSAAGAVISYLWGITIRAPHGGVFVVFAMNKVLPFFITLLIAGAISAALIVLVTKPQEEA